MRFLKILEFLLKTLKSLWQIGTILLIPVLLFSLFDLKFTGFNSTSIIILTVFIASITLLYFFTSFRQMFMKHYLIEYSIYENRSAKGSKSVIERFYKQDIEVSSGFSYPQRLHIEKQLLAIWKKRNPKTHRVIIGVPKRIKYAEVIQWKAESVESKNTALRKVKEFNKQIKQ